MADRLQASRAACPRRRQRVAVALSAQATLRLGAPSSRPHSATLLFHFTSVSFAVRSTRKHSRRAPAAPPSSLTAQATPSRFSITATASPSSPQLPAPASARRSSSVSSSPAHRLAGAPPPPPSSWPGPTRPPQATRAHVLASL